MSDKKVDLAKLIDAYEKLSKEIKKLRITVGELSEKYKEVEKSLGGIEKALVKRGILVPYHKIVVGRSVWVYIDLNKTAAKEALKRGIFPHRLFASKGEEKVFLETLKKRKINIPPEVIVARLTPEPWRSAETAIKYIMFKAKVGLQYVYFGDWNFFFYLAGVSDPKERIKFIKLFAETIAPSSMLKREDTEDLSRFVALITRPIKPTELHITYEWVKLLGETDNMTYVANQVV